MKYQKLSLWSKDRGINYKTAWNWIKKGIFPEKISKTQSGMLFVCLEEEINPIKEEIVCIYGRVSSQDKKQDLINQVKLCEEYCIKQGWQINKIYKEISSGMNDNRKFLNQILENPPTKLVILYKDRLTRFGFNYLKTLLNKLNCQIIVINENGSVQEDILKDFIAIITSFCCRLYGARRGQSKALKLKEEIKNKD